MTVKEKKPKPNKEKPPTENNRRPNTIIIIKSKVSKQMNQLCLQHAAESEASCHQQSRQGWGESCTYRRKWKPTGSDPFLIQSVSSSFLPLGMVNGFSIDQICRRRCLHVMYQKARSNESEKIKADVHKHSPLDTSHTRTVLSRLPVQIRVPSLLHDTTST